MGAEDLPTWAPALSPDLAARALQVSLDVAGRLRDRECVGLAIAAAPGQTAFPLAVNWQAPTLAQGDAGLALVCSYLDACLPEGEWDRPGHNYLASAGAAAELLPNPQAGMYSGLTGLAFAAWSLSRGGTRYRRLLTSIDTLLLPRAAGQAQGLTRADGDGMSVSEFDVISGCAGVGAYLLSRRDDPGAAAALEAVLRAIVAIARGARPRPRWWTPAHLLFDEETAAMYPHGNLNCGLAHGIPGPLALLSLAFARGIRVTGIEEAAERLAVWLVTNRADDAWGVNWPYSVPLTREGRPDRRAKAYGPSRTAWCYGAPGVARALWLAGVAFDRPAWRELALEAMQAVYRRPVAARYIDSPTFCHGVAGLLQITLRFAHDTRLPTFTEAAVDLTEWLLSAFEPNSVLGYRNWEPGGTRVDHPGLLDGAPGVLLTLLAASSAVEPTWDRMFLIS
jgi:lantibiotic biosynthesis protein